jgi:hypothetical protein
MVKKKKAEQDNLLSQQTNCYEKNQTNTSTLKSNLIGYPVNLLHKYYFKAGLVSGVLIRFIHHSVRQNFI